MKNQIKAEIIAASENPMGGKIYTFLCTYPRFIHAEMMTHRVFSRNAASSRAIPFNKMVKQVEEDPFVPIAFQKDHSGMQGKKYLIGRGLEAAKHSWIVNAEDAAYNAKMLHSKEVTKQLCNRPLEPFLWYTNLITTTELDNFFDLRCPKYNTPVGKFRSKKDAMAHYATGGVMEDMPETDLDWLLCNESMAEIHIQALAESMWDAVNECTPVKLQAGAWHIPFGDRIDEASLFDTVCNTTEVYRSTENSEMLKATLKVATARAARLSYMTFNGEIDYEEDLDLHDSLCKRPYTNRKGIHFAEDDPIHASPFEHCNKAMGPEDLDEFGRLEDGEFQPGWCRNVRGFIPYRFILEKKKS